MFSSAFSSLFGQDAVNRRPAYAERSRNRARRLTARVHALSQSRFRLIKRPGTPNVLPACPTRLACGSTPFAAQLKFKLGQAGQYSGNHSACGVGRVDALS